MASLATIFPRPRIWQAGGREFLVSELRVRDLAALQAYVEACCPHPYRAVREGDYPDDAARSLAAADAIEIAEEWPPEYGSDEARAVMDPTGHAALLLVLALAPCHPDFTAEDAVALLGEIGGAEDSWACWDEFRRLAFGADPDMALARLADPTWGSGESANAGWPEAVDQISRDRGLSYDRVGDMTLNQFRNARAGGLKKGAAFWADAPDSHEAALEADRRLKLFGGGAA